MSTGTALVVEKSDVGSPEQDMTPYLIRWGFQFAMRDKIMSAYECGISRVPLAKWFPVKSFTVPRENHTTDDTKPRESLATIPAAEVEAYLMQALGGTGIQENVNWGLKTAFRGEEDVSKMAVITEVLAPSLPVIREIAASFGTQVIEAVCPSSDDLDYGSRDSCVTCNFQWLNSDVLTQYIEQVAFQGMAVSERDPHTGSVVDRIVKPTYEELNTARTVALDAARQGLKQLQDQWSQIAAEYDSTDRIRKDISEFEHGYRKDLHQNKPQDRQFALAREMAKGNNSALLESLALSQMQTNQLLQQMAARDAGGMKLAETSEIPRVDVPMAQTVTVPMGDAVTTSKVIADIKTATTKKEK